MQPLQSLSERLEALLWGRPIERLPRWQVWLTWLGRLVYALIRDLALGYLSLQAMSLVYTTLLSLVPLLAVSFSVLKGFGVHNQLQPMLLNLLDPLGEPGQQIATSIVGFVDNMQVGVLGTVGLTGLLYTVISLLQKIEQVFNDTWRVREGRPFVQRFSLYLSVLLIGPVLVVSAIGLSASLSSNHYVQNFMAAQIMRPAAEVFGSLGPYLMISLIFAFCYVVIPSAQVRIRSALVGALVAGLLWEVVGGMFAAFMVGFTRFTAIYSSLAIVVLLMMWIYIGWLILLIGASIAFYHQHPEYLTTQTRDPTLSGRLLERLTLLVAGTIAERFLSGAAPLTDEDLSKRMEAPLTEIQRVLGMLEGAGLVLRTAHQRPGYVPGRATATIPLQALLTTVRTFQEPTGSRLTDRPGPAIEGIETRIETALGQALAGMTLRDLAEEIGREDAASGFTGRPET